MAETERKVVATITPAAVEHVPAAHQLEETWAELVIVKARLAECMNELKIVQRDMDEHHDYVKRAVKRIDATAGRLQRERAQMPTRVRG